jgi:cyclic AMP-dependent transcription factor ATF-2
MIGTDETDETETTSPFEMHYGDQLSALFPGGRPVEPRRDSLANSEEAETSPGTRTRIFRGRRRSEYVEPGSARAIYLEKNRKAAAKCRSKQKMEQDALVEESRRAERLNRHLRAEEAMVRAEVHHLREQLAQHVNCPDQRIAQYLQQEADRLAGRGMGPPHQ